MITRYALIDGEITKDPTGELVSYDIYRSTVNALIVEIFELNEELKKARGDNAT